MVLDTDTYNEIDDQFALVYALLCPEKLNVEAVYAALFTNDRSTGARRRDGEELAKKSCACWNGCTWTGGICLPSWLHRLPGAVVSFLRSAAVDDLIRRAVAARTTTRSM